MDERKRIILDSIISGLDFNLIVYGLNNSSCYYCKYREICTGCDASDNKINGSLCMELLKKLKKNI